MINIAIIGAGIGREHLAALRELPTEFRVVAVVDQNGTSNIICIVYRACCFERCYFIHLSVFWGTLYCPK